MKRIFIVWLWFILATKTYPSVPMVTQFTYAPAEIKNAQIYDIIEFDNEIYFATSKVFLKYNGKDIYTFSNSDSLITMDIFNFQVYNNKLWFNDLLGRLYYIAQRETRIHLYKPISDAKIKSFFWNKEFLYYTDINGQIWVYDENMTSKKNLSKKLPNSLAFKQTDKYLYILHSEFTYSWIDMETQSLCTVGTPQYNSSTPIKNKSDWHPPHQLYSFDKNVVAILNVQKNIYTPIITLPKEHIIYAIYPIDSLKMLIGTQKGLYWVEQGKISSMPLQKFITNIFKDSEDRFWITTFNGGIFLIHNTEIRTYETVAASILSNEVTLSKIAMYEGKPVYGSQTGQVWFNHQLIDNIKLNYEKGRLNRVLDIQIKNNNIYIVRDDGIYIYQPDTRTTKYISSNLPSIKKLLFYKSDTIIIGAYLGLFKLDLHHKKILKKYSSPRMVDIILWKNVPIVIGYHQIFLFEKDTLREVLTNKYKFDRIYFAYSDTQYKVLYIAHQKGIDAYDENWNILYSIPIYQNEPTKIIAYQKYLYIATQKGLFILFRAPNLKNQFQIESITQNLCMYDINFYQDTIHFVSDMGYSYIPVSKLSTINNNIPVQGYYAKADSLTPIQEKIYLHHPDNVLKLFLFPKTIRYQSSLRYEYMVKDKHNQILWSEKTYYPKVNIPFFHTGKYLIIISTYANNLLVNQQTFELHYTLPIWKEKSFNIFLVIVFVLLIIIFYIYQSVQKEKRKNTEKKLKIENLQYQLNAIQSRLNPHFIFNAMQSLQYLITSHQNDIARKYLNNFSQLLRRFLDFSCQEFTSIEEEIEILEKYLTIENIAREQKVNYKYCVNIEDPNIISEKFIPALILQPIVENTFKHAFPEYHPDPQLIIRFTDNPEKHQFYIEIEDNGVGMPNKINANSKGMQLIMQRLEILNQKGIHKYELSISNSQSYNQGTLICLTVTF